MCLFYKYSFYYYFIIVYTFENVNYVELNYLNYKDSERNNNILIMIVLDKNYEMIYLIFLIKSVITKRCIPLK